jgi:hypothetical protein
MDFGGLLVLGIVWLLFNLIGQGRARTASRGAPSRPTPQPRPPGGIDPTQQEGSRLERLLRELERNLEQVADRQPRGGPRLPAPQRPATAKLPIPPAEEEDVENRESLEEPEQVLSLEANVQRGPRVVYDQDTEAEAIVQRRIDAARARDRALGKSDHSSFDARIRQEAADHTAVRRYTPAQLRDAIVWREILGRPVSDRDHPSP